MTKQLYVFDFNAEELIQLKQQENNLAIINDLLALRMQEVKKE